MFQHRSDGGPAMALRSGVSRTDPQVTVIKGKNPCSHNTLLWYWINVETMHLSLVKRWDITGSSCVFSYTGMPQSPNVGLRLAHRLRRCANLKPTLGPRLVFSRDGGTHHTPHVIQCLLCGPATMTMRRRNPIEICLIISHPWRSKGNWIENCHDSISVKGILHVHILGGLKETKMFLLHPRVKVSIVGSLRDREVACSASDRQGSNFESCVWRTVSSQSSHHPQEVLLAQFSLYVHKGGLKPDSFHFHVHMNAFQCNFALHNTNHKAETCV